MKFASCIDPAVVLTRVFWLPLTSMSQNRCPPMVLVRSINPKSLGEAPFWHGSPPPAACIQPMGNGWSGHHSAARLAIRCGPGDSSSGPSPVHAATLGAISSAVVCTVAEARPDRIGILIPERDMCAIDLGISGPVDEGCEPAAERTIFTTCCACR
jgi:hypothetical protein